MKLMIFLFFLICFLACNQTPEKKNQSAEPASPEISLPAENQSVIDQQVSKILTEYFLLKDALVETDSLMIGNAAVRLLSATDSFNTESIISDIALVEKAEKYQNNISAETKGLIGESDLSEKRKAFRMVTENLKALVETVLYKGQTIYEQTCPMAFNGNESASWLSNSTQIVNPYLGKKHPKYSAGMLHCGELTDTLSFR